ncbi:DUF3800 domain-containing protein [Iodobacter fluviatilis]|uniref:Protein of uncharacterized function (DUF3800) n=1 Tax=Iodobacter fluviatilis TaxID=537 RepID=A0A377Q2Z2_9NEIS|nr:DUF3800 domain-containing protein [Iodobacter fluviatilis]TCU90101.1 uncharacterized protein DUF3800 [Iodobacter fluviatilis]STQ89128.1 Protein of uncharacterised function (DUF3800) [Iodobacter fluviatilis]
MNELFHVYCDESCHLENDAAKAMVLGAVWCPASHRQMLARELKALKKQYGLAPNFEIKWVKVSPSKLDFYLAVIDLFFAQPLLHFRGLVVPDKSCLQHDKFGQSHDEFYYKMWYHLLNRLISPEERYRIFLDIKDTQGQAKVGKLHDVLCNANYDFDRAVIESIELVHSHDVLLLQLADLLIGALGYVHRGLTESPAKLAVIARIREQSGLNLLQSSLVRAEKFNVFVWRPQA